MPTYVERYAIGVARPSANDLYNLKEDFDSVVGVATIDFTDQESGGSFRRVTGFVEIVDLDTFDAVDESIISGTGVIKFVALKAFEDLDTVLGVAEANSADSGFVDFDTVGEGMASVSSFLGIDGEESALVYGISFSEWKDDFISPANSTVLFGIGGVLYRDRYSAEDNSTSIGVASILTKREGGIHRLSGTILSSSTVSNVYAINADTPDNTIIIGVTVIEAIWDEFFVVAGSSYMFADVSEGVVESSVTEGSAISYGEDDFPVQYDFIANPPFGQSGDGFVVGHGVVLEESTPYVINAPDFSTVFSAFQYSISAIELYNYQPLLDGFSQGSSSVDLSGVAMGMGVQPISGESIVLTEGLFIGVTRYFTPVTDVSGDGTRITYTADNTFAAGQKVTVVNDVTPTTSLWWEIADAVIYSATSTQFVVTNSNTGAFSSSDAKALVGHPYYNDAQGEYT